MEEVCLEPGMQRGSEGLGAGVNSLGLNLSSALFPLCECGQVHIFLRASVSHLENEIIIIATP